jgi:hypothetical protein
VRRAEGGRAHPRRAARARRHRRHRHRPRRLPRPLRPLPRQARRRPLLPRQRGRERRPRLQLPADRRHGDGRRARLPLRELGPGLRRPPRRARPRHPAPPLLARPLGASDLRPRDGPARRWRWRRARCCAARSSAPPPPATARWAPPSSSTTSSARATRRRSARGFEADWSRSGCYIEDYHMLQGTRTEALPRRPAPPPRGELGNPGRELEQGRVRVPGQHELNIRNTLRRARDEPTATPSYKQCGQGDRARPGPGGDLHGEVALTTLDVGSSMPPPPERCGTSPASGRCSPATTTWVRSPPPTPSAGSSAAGCSTLREAIAPF